MKKYLPLKENAKNFTDILIETEYRRDPYNAPRGYYIYIHPVKRAGGLVTVCPSDGVRALLKAVTRGSEKAAADAERIADINAGRLVADVLKKNGIELE